MATANLRRQIPLLAVRTRQPDPSVAATAMVATPPPRGALGRTRTASEADDADEAAPPAKRDCATSTANSRQQTYLTTFRVRPLQTPATPTMTPNQGSRPPCERAPERWRSASPRAQLPIFPPSASTQERASTRARPPQGHHKPLQQTSPPPHSPLPGSCNNSHTSRPLVGSDPGRPWSPRRTTHRYPRSRLPGLPRDQFSRPWLFF